MNIGIGSDHAGFLLKSSIINYFKKKAISYTDFGTDSVESVDYPDFIFLVAKAVSENKVDSGVVICGSGIGASIVANKIKGIRAARCENEYVARFSRRHNDANVLALGERVMGSELAIAIIDVWINTGFDGGRHQKKVK